MALGGFDGHGALAAETVPVIRNETVNRAEDGFYSGNLRKREEWPGPPDGTGDFDDGIRAAKGLAIGSEQFHFDQGRPLL